MSMGVRICSRLCILRSMVMLKARGTAGVRPRSTKVQAAFSLQNLFKPAQTGTRRAKDDAMKKLLSSIESTSRGTVQSKEQRSEILGQLDVLKELAVEDPGVDEGLLSGTWRLIWTTEKEILGIIKEGGIASWFGTSAGDVLQVIDLQRNRLQNCIEFPPVGAFLVDSSIQFDEEDQKCSFQFRGAALKTDKRTIKLPPMGKSRFQTLYVSKSHRVAFDDRGDYLIVERLGAPRDLYAQYDI